MRINLKGFLFFLLIVSFECIAQKHGKDDSVKVKQLIDSSKALIGSDSAMAVTLSLDARNLAQEIKFQKGEALALKNLGMVYFLRGHFYETIEYWTQSLDVFRQVNDEDGVANMLNNIAAVYFEQGGDEKALDYSLQSLKVAEKLGDTLRILSALTTIGAIYHNTLNPKASEYLLKALPLSKAIGNTNSYIIIAGNLGEVYFDAKNYDNAMQYFQKAIDEAPESDVTAFAYNGLGKVFLKKGRKNLALQSHQTALQLSENSGDKLQIVRSLRGIADVYSTDNISLAIEYYERARKIVEGMENAQVELKDVYQDIAEAYSRAKDFPKAFEYQTKYAKIKDDIFELETRKKLNQASFEFEMDKKKAEIGLKESEVKSEKQKRVGVTLGLGLIVLIAVIIYRNYLQKAKTNKILDKQKDEIEHLLLNILPVEVASELQTSGESKPRHFENVSVLFTDFKGFTAIADKMSPTDLVEELNECFMAFDSIIEKYDLEKIKTIGDAYMCAGNIPSPDPNHAYKIIRAGLDIQDFISGYNARRRDKGLEPWEIRVGAHIGPVVAGVVGKKKYAYDIWGGTVNIGSRMESNGVPGRVNISAALYETVKEFFVCSYRGKINAKNLGEIDMYFVDYEIEGNRYRQSGMTITTAENVV